MLLPEGLLPSPYEILGYGVTLTLHDERGVRASFRRTQRVRFLQNGVSAILDHMWGKGIPIASYYNDAGPLEDWFNDQGRRHLVIGLKRAMAKGEILRFEVDRTAMVGFTSGHAEWTDTIIDHPVRRLASRIVFPQSRPVMRGTLHYGGRRKKLPIRRLADGRTALSFQSSTPRPHLRYLVRWEW